MNDGRKKFDGWFYIGVLFTALFWFARYLCPPVASQVTETHQESDVDDAAVA